MPLFEGLRLAREPSPQSDDSAGTSLVCCRHIQIARSFARLDPPVISCWYSNSTAGSANLPNQQLPVFLLDE
jgi:hypothetical protein